MLKSLFILIAMGFAVPSVSSQQKPSSQQHEQERQGDATHANSPSTSITNDQSTGYYQQGNEDKPHGWHKFVTWPEGITAWAIMLTLGAIVWQSWETRRAAIAAQASTKLQETAYEQWVQLGNWEGEISWEPNSLTIRVDLVNATNFPLTLRSVCITLQLETEAHLICKDRVLPPNEPVRMSVAIALTELQIATFLGDGIGVFVKGSIEFTSILKRPAAQNFQGLLLCDTKGTKFEYTIP